MLAIFEKNNKFIQISLANFLVVDVDRSSIWGLAAVSSFEVYGDGILLRVID